MNVNTPVCVTIQVTGRKVQWVKVLASPLRSLPPLMTPPRTIPVLLGMLPTKLVRLWFMMNRLVVLGPMLEAAERSIRTLAPFTPPRMLPTPTLITRSELRLEL